MTKHPNEKIIQYLAEAHALELALVSNLTAHIALTPRGRHRSILERHVRETREQAQAIERRLTELGRRRSPVAQAWDAARTVAEAAIGQALVLSKGPLDLLRGESLEEKLVKNAKDEATTEIQEIAAYDALERLARRLGDERTARLAADHREQEERVLAELRDLIPELVDAVIAAELEGEHRADPAATGLADNVRELAEAARERAPGGGHGEGGEPWSGYDRQSAAEVARRLGRATPQVVERVREYERAHRSRATVLRAAERQASGV